MRKIVLIATALLTASGLVLAWFAPVELDLAWRRWFSLFRIWVGVFFLVAFTMYAWDHISANRHWLRIAALVTATGVIQTAAALLIILTGVVLLLYGNVPWSALRNLHHWLTYALVFSIALHFFSRKS